MTLANISTISGPTEMKYLKLTEHRSSIPDIALGSAGNKVLVNKYLLVKQQLRVPPFIFN